MKNQKHTEWCIDAPQKGKGDETMSGKWVKGKKLKICNNCRKMGQKTIGTSEIGYLFPCNAKPSKRYHDLTSPFGFCPLFKRVKKEGIKK